jgi:hypothetical protein
MTDGKSNLLNYFGNMLDYSLVCLLNGVNRFWPYISAKSLWQEAQGEDLEKASQSDTVMKSFIFSNVAEPMPLTLSKSSILLNGPFWLR